MNTKNYDRIIDLYLDGALSPVEEREFRNLLEIDSDVRNLFEAELAVRATFAEDAEAIPVETERSYAKFLAALAATSPAATGESPAAAAGPGPKGAGAWLPGGAMKFAGAVVATLGMAGAGYLALSGGDVAERAAQRAPAASTASPPTIEAPASSAASGGPSATGAATDATSGTVANATTQRQSIAPGGLGASSTSTQRSAVTDRSRDARASGTDRRPTSAADASRVGGVARPETRALVDPHDDLTEIGQRSGDIDDLPLIESDSVDTRVRFKTRAR